MESGRVIMVHMSRTATVVHLQKGFGNVWVGGYMTHQMSTDGTNLVCLDQLDLPENSHRRVQIQLGGDVLPISISRSLRSGYENEAEDYKPDYLIIKTELDRKF